jgi:ABC-type branched-subunit amino acid transport system ATPase component
MALLEAIDVVKRFGGVRAVNGFSLVLEPGQVAALIGPNGAGKSTFMNILSGVHRADGGEIAFEGHAIHALNPSRIARLGMGRTFQTPRVFRRLTVADNVLVPMTYRGVVSGGVRDRVGELLELVDLTRHAGHYARERSGGQQKLLELARALMPDPRLVLMDEPFAGVHPELKQTLIEAIRTANQEKGTTFLIVSHEMPVVAALCGQVFAMHLGQNYLAGPPHEVLNEERLVDIYLGQAESTRHADPG